MTSNQQGFAINMQPSADQVYTGEAPGGAPPESGDSNLTMHIERPVFTVDEFNRRYTPSEEFVPTKERVRRRMKQVKCPDVAKHFIHSVLPCTKWLPQYKLRQFLPSDIIAGITMGIVNIPQGLAYSILAGLPAVYGLYTTFFPVLIYFFMGTSKHLSMGTFAVVSLMCRETVNRVLLEQFPSAATETSDPTGMSYNSTTADAHGGINIEDERVKIHVALCLIVGILQVLMGICRCGFVTVYLSEALVRAFTTGAAIHVLTSQMPSALGIHVPGRSLGDTTPEVLYIWKVLMVNISTSNGATIIIFVISFGILAIVKEILEKYKHKIKFNVPIELIVVIISILISKFAYMHEKHHVDIINDIKTGFPPPRSPTYLSSLFGSLFGDGFAIAIVAFALSVSLSKTFAARNNYEIDSNQEMLSYGVSNIISSFFHCFVCCGALARTSIQEAVGGKTQIVTLVSSTMVMFVLLFMAPWFEPLPKAVLAAIICQGLKGMFLQFKDLHSLFQYSRYDFVIWLATFCAVVFIGVDLGLGVGVVVALFVTVVRTQTPKFSTRGHIDGTEIYKSVKRYKCAKEHNQVKIVQMQGSLYFANSELFRNQIYESSGVNPVKTVVKLEKAQAKDEKVRKRSIQAGVLLDEDTLAGTFEEQFRQKSLTLKAIIIDCGHFGFVDSMGAKTLSVLVSDYKDVGVSVVLANCSDSVMQSLLCMSPINPELFYMTVHDAWMSLNNTTLQSPLASMHSEDGVEADQTPANVTNGSVCYVNGAFQSEVATVECSFNGNIPNSGNEAERTRDGATI